MMLVHRVIFAMAHGRWPVGHLDHIDGDKLNNRPENLREATRSQNQSNQGLKKTNKSGRKGVCWHRQAGKWVSQINVCNQTIYLGIYDDIDLAAFVYECAALKYHGEFARI